MKKIHFILTIMISMLFSMSAWATENSKGADKDICSADSLEIKDPKTAIECTVNNIINTLKARTDKTVLTDQDRANIRQTIEGRFNYSYMARRSLGSKTWKLLNKDEKVHFIDVNRELLERSYGSRLAKYNDQEVIFAEAKLKETRRGTIATVDSTVIDGATKIPVTYKLHQTKTGWQVYEILIEGIAMVRTKYKEYKAVRKNYEGHEGYEELIRMLENKLVKLKERDQG